MTRTIATMAAVVALAGGVAAAGPAAPAGEPAPSPQLTSMLNKAQQFRELVITEGDEIKLGQAVSEKVRARYGVVQDANVHRYVTLVGAVLAVSTPRPNLPWTFIVLDTDGVNAFAAPGGFVHITRGALALLKSEAELAGVLAHEIEHVVQKHTVTALQKNKAIQLGASETLGDKSVFNKLVEKTTEAVMAGFGRKEELESDREGLRLSNNVGYDPHGLAAFLQRLSDRNKSATEKQGLFASHPEMQERLDLLAKQVTSEKLASTATLEPRYRKFITYTPKAQTEIAKVESGSAGLASGGKSDKPAAKEPEKKEEEQPKKKGFGLGSLMKPAGGSESKSAEVTGSGASRGVDTERNAKGGSNPALVQVNVNRGDIEDFKKEGKLK
jgi:beta-barrel assembly-enhancing protease